jgi:type IV secretion system protein VirB5
MSTSTSPRFQHPVPPETVYRSAHDLWDRRMGLAVASAAHWRTLSFALLGVCALLSGALSLLALKPRAIPYVIEADPNGQARLVGPATERYDPTDAQIAWHLSRFVEQVRSISSDPVLMRRSWLRAYEQTTEEGAAALNAIASGMDPFAQVGKRTVSVEILSAMRAGPQTFQIRWRERSFASARPVSEDVFTGLITTAVHAPDTEADLRTNPLGVYVHAFTLSREMTP